MFFNQCYRQTDDFKCSHIPDMNNRLQKNPLKTFSMSYMQNIYQNLLRILKNCKFKQIKIHTFNSSFCWWFWYHWIFCEWFLTLNDSHVYCHLKWLLNLLDSNWFMLCNTLPTNSLNPVLFFSDALFLQLAFHF